MTALALVSNNAFSIASNSLHSNFDLKEYTQEQQTQLMSCVFQIRLSMGRQTMETMYMTQQLVWMRDILGSKMVEFAEVELGIKERRLYRYFKTHQILEAHFKTDGKIDFTQAGNFSMNALQLLNPDIEDNIVDELRLLASKGEQISERTVRELLEKSSETSVQIIDAQADAEAAQAEAREAVQSLNIVKAEKELVEAQLIRSESKSAEMLRRNEGTQLELQKEIDALKAQSIQVTEVVKEVAPAGYESAMQAVNDVNKKLQDLETRKRELEDSNKELQQHIDELNAGADEFMKFKVLAESLISKYPIARIQSLAATDPKIKRAIAALGMAFTEIGTNIAEATAA